MEFLELLFHFVCGQIHRWTVAGQLLPFCERCTGLYVGGIYAFVTTALFGPKPTRFWLCLHGALLLLMIPFGYHLVIENSMVRTVMGQLFAIGLTYFLLLTPVSVMTRERTSSGRSGWFYLSIALAGIPVL